MKLFNCVCLLLTIFCVSVYANSMMYYKKNVNHKYEAGVLVSLIMQISYITMYSFLITELIPVSSTVIPLSEYSVSAGLQPSNEYKKAYYKLFGKKVEHRGQNPDTLITCKTMNTWQFSLS